MARRKLRKNEARRIAGERIEILFCLAEASFASAPELSDRYILRARRLAMRHRIRLKREYKRRFCSRCHAWQVPGVNQRIRIYRGKIIITCRRCGHQLRIPVVRAHPEKK